MSVSRNPWGEEGAGRGGASAPCTVTASAGGLGLARFIASLQTLVARADRASARIRKYTIFLWASGSIFNILVDLGFNIQYSSIKVCGPSWNMAANNLVEGRALPFFLVSTVMTVMTVS
jgi:hypothetical protein